MICFQETKYWVAYDQCSILVAECKVHCLLHFWPNQKAYCKGYQKETLAGAPTLGASEFVKPLAPLFYLMEKRNQTVWYCENFRFALQLYIICFHDSNSLYIFIGFYHCVSRKLERENTHAHHANLMFSPLWVIQMANQCPICPLKFQSLPIILTITASKLLC